MPDAAGILPIGLAKVLNSANPAVGQSDDVGRKCVSDLPLSIIPGPRRSSSRFEKMVVCPRYPLLTNVCPLLPLEQYKINIEVVIHTMPSFKSKIDYPLEIPWG